MADDFERAVIYVFDETGATPLDLKKRAQEYCSEIKRMPDSWQLFIQRTDETAYESVRFWCLSALQEALRARYADLKAAHKIAIKQRLAAWLRRPVTKQGASFAAFLKNKVAQLVVYIVQVDYPKEWPTFFHDLVAMLGEGSQAVDMFCRVLVAVDQDVVSLEIPRTHEEIQRSMALKDAMRESCLKDVLDACIQLVASLHNSNTELTTSVLDAVARYVNWIDIGLVANDRFVPLLFGLLQSDQEELQAAAADVLTEIVSKRMDAETKLRLIQQLGLVPVAAAWRAGLPGDSEGELPLKCARLLAALSNEVLDSWKKVENAVVSISSVGLSVDNEAAGDASAAVSAAQSLLADVFPAILVTVRNPEEDVRLAVIPFLQAYVNKLKTSLKRLRALPEAHLQQITPILEAIADCSRFPPDAPRIEPENEPGKTEWEETAEVLAERRRELFTLFKNVAKIAPEQTITFLGSRLQLLLAAGTAFEDVEATVSLLYEAGEGANEEMQKPGCGALGQLALGLMQLKAPNGEHRLVSLALMETYVRYHKVLAQNPQVLNRVLGNFLGDNGIGHADQGVGARACYLFCRLVKAVRSNLRALVLELLTALQPHLDRVAKSPRPEPPSATKSPSGISSTTDDRLYAHEAAGLLIGGEDLPAEEQLAYLSALMQPLLGQIEQNLPAVKDSPPTAATVTHDPASDLAASMVVQALEGLSRLSKGLTLSLCTVKRPAVGESLAIPLQTALRIPQAAPYNRPLRARVISFLHRLVECLGPHLLPYLPQALSALMPPSTDRTDLVDVFTLLNQLIIRYKATLDPLLTSVLPEAVRRVHVQLPAHWDWTGRTALPPTNSASGAAVGGEEAREMGELQKAYYSLLHCISANRLTGTLLRMDGRNLDLVLNSLLTGASAHVEPPIRKACIQILKQIVGEVGKDGQAPVGYHDFVLQLAGPVCLQSVMTSGLDVRDAAVNSLLGEVAALLQLLTKQAGPSLVQHLSATVLPPLALPALLQEELLKGLTSQDFNGLKATLRLLVQQASNAPPGSKASSRCHDSVSKAPQKSTRGGSPDSNGMVM